MGIEYRLLGRLEVLSDGTPVDLGSHRQRALLALLLVNAGTVLSTDRILDELWTDAGAADKHSSLWVYVSGLRGALEPEPRSAQRARSCSRGALDTSRRSTRLTSMSDGSTGASQRHGSSPRPTRRPPRPPFAMGIALWRGHALEEFVYEGWAQAEISRLRGASA